MSNRSSLIKPESNSNLPFLAGGGIYYQKVELFETNLLVVDWGKPLHKIGNAKIELTSNRLGQIFMDRMRGHHMLLAI